MGLKCPVLLLLTPPPNLPQLQQPSRPSANQKEPNFWPEMAKGKKSKSVDMKTEFKDTTVCVCV